ncbi:MAG TPA: VOC family protein [Actinomycetota bacterium]|nr:VOC family protein [Actinomycetota bacterium]
MTSRFTEVCIDCADPASLAAFWKEVLGWEFSEEEEDSVELKNPESEWPVLLFAKVPEKKTTKNRLHIDVSPRDRTQDEELERLLALGARRADVGQGEDVSWVVLADPEGNEFCLLKTMRP